MQSFKERLLISREEYEVLKQGETSQTKPSMKRDLAKLPHDLPADQKQQLEGEIINRYTTKHVSSPPPPPNIPSTQPVTSSVEEIVQGFPTSNRYRANQLLNFLKAQASPFYNDSMNFIANGQVIPGSNIVDLVQFITSVKSSTSKNIPQGFEHFMNLLAKLNVPKTFLSAYGKILLSSFNTGTVNKQDVEEYALEHWDEFNE